MLAVLLFLAFRVFANELEAPGLVAAFCDGKTGEVSYTAPPGFLIAEDNFFIVSGCNGTATLTLEGTIEGTKKVTANTDCTTGKTAVVPIGFDATSVHITSSGVCGDARVTADSNDQGAFASSSCGKKNPVGPIRLVKLMPNIRAYCCSAPHKDCGTGTGTAPDGYEINGKKNYFVVTGCNSIGRVPSLGISSQTDCVSGKTPAKTVGTNVKSLSITGGGYCGESRITRLPGDDGVYAGGNGTVSQPGIILTPIGALLETQAKKSYRPALFLSQSQGQRHVALLKSRLEARGEALLESQQTGNKGGGGRGKRG